MSAHPGPRSRTPPAGRGRSAAGSRPSGRPAGHARRRAGCGRRSRPEAASTRPSSSRAPCRGASGECPPRPSRYRARASCPATRERSRAAARGSRAGRRGPAARRVDDRRASCGHRLQLGQCHVLDFGDRELEEPAPHRTECRRIACRQETIRALPSRLVLDRLACSVSETSSAVSSAEKTSVTSRPNTRCRMGRIRG